MHFLKQARWQLRRFVIGALRPAAQWVIIALAAAGFVGGAFAVLHASEPPPELAMATAAYNDGRFSEAVRLYSLVLKKGTYLSAAFFGRGLSHEMLNQQTKAEADYRSAIESDPGNYRAMESLAGIWERSGKHVAEAAELYKRALALDPRPEWIENLKVWIAILESRLNCEERSPVACFHRANAKAAQGDQKSAETLYSQALSLNPGMFQAYYSRGILRFKAQDLNGALRDLDEAIRIAPRGRGYLIQRGLIFESMGEMEKAKQDFQRAVQLDPRDPHTFYHLARTREQDRDYEAALQLYQDALKLRVKPELSRLLQERVAAVSALVKPHRTKSHERGVRSDDLW